MKGKKGINMEVNTGIVRQNRQEISDGLSRLLADTHVMYVKTQCSHWNVRGVEFYALHLLFEAQYKEMAEAIDEIAERMGALGFFVEASLHAFKAKTKIKEEDKVGSAKEMLISLLEGHELLVRETRVLLGIAERDKDGATVDLLGRRLGAHEKMAWFLRSHLA